MDQAVYPRRTADGRGMTWACCESLIGPPCGHRQGGFDPQIELNRLRRLTEILLAGPDDLPEAARALAHTARDLDQHLSAMVTGGDWLTALANPRSPATPGRQPLVDRRATGPCPCRSGYDTNPGSHNNQVATHGRCRCSCHGGAR